MATSKQTYEQMFLPSDQVEFLETGSVDELPNDWNRASLGFENGIVLDLIDSLQKPPPIFTEAYLRLLLRVCSWLNRVQEQSSTENNSISYDYEKRKNEVNKARNDIFDVMKRVNSFVLRAKNAGFSPPQNPFMLAMKFNSGRVGFPAISISKEISLQIFSGISQYVKLLEAEKEGKLNLEKNGFKAAQLSSVTLSLDGLGGTGNTVVDISKLLPDLDFVKKQKAFESLSVFDFSRQVPKVLFTSYYSPAGIPMGVIVGWKKVQGASGYVIRRKSIFEGKEIKYTASNEDVKRDTDRLKEYVKAWILSFYDTVKDDLVVTYLDTDLKPDEYYLYKVQAYQMQSDFAGKMFSVETSPAFLSKSQKEYIRKEIEKLDPGDGKDNVSPYPLLAEVLLGSNKYDWILAGVNVRGSVNRSDARSVTRSYSYLSAQLDFIFAQSDAGKFLVPKGKDVSSVIGKIQDSISKFGVGQVLKEILQETGALYYFEGKDPSDNSDFKNIDVGNGNDSDLIAVVASAVDPETSIINLKTLTTNLHVMLAGELERHPREKTKSKSLITELDISESGDTSSVLNENVIGDGTADLTTVDGMSVFMRTLRTLSDIGPGMSSRKENKRKVVDPVSRQTLDTPALSSVQPVRIPLSFSNRIISRNGDDTDTEK